MLQVLRGIRDALVDLGGDLLDRTLALCQYLDDLSAPAARESLGRAQSSASNSAAFAIRSAIPGTHF